MTFETEELKTSESAVVNESQSNQSLIHFIIIHTAVCLAFVFIESHVFEGQTTMLTCEAIRMPTSAKGVDNVSSNDLLTSCTEKRRTCL